jgi:type VI secretion system secreted protein Hcp
VASHGGCDRHHRAAGRQLLQSPLNQCLDYFEEKKMAVDYFLKIDGIPGESTDSKHNDEINIHSWSWGETQATGPGPGGGVGRVSMQDFRFSKAVDKASPKLMLACASGQHIKEAVLSCHKAGGVLNDFLTITLTEVTVSSYETAGNSGAPIDPMDQFALHFAKIEFNYVQEKSDGTMDAGTQAGWDVKNNKPA